MKPLGIFCTLRYFLTVRFLLPVLPQAQVTSSDALKNAPFILIAAGTSGAKLDFMPNETFTEMNGQKTNVNVIKIPKSTIGFVTAGKYKITETIDHMPLVSIHRKKDLLCLAKVMCEALIRFSLRGHTSSWNEKSPE